MSVSDFFDIHHTALNVPIGTGYPLSWIELVGSISGLLCIGLASREKVINYLFGLVNVTLFAVIFYQKQLYALLLLQIFFFGANIYGGFAWSGRDRTGQPILTVRWLSLRHLSQIVLVSVLAIALMTVYIDAIFTALAHSSVRAMRALGWGVVWLPTKPDAFPFWGSVVTVLSVVAQILMTRKYVENWLLWSLINVISIGIYSAQGIYAVALQYIILLLITLRGSWLWARTAASPHAEVV